MTSGVGNLMLNVSVLSRLLHLRSNEVAKAKRKKRTRKPYSAVDIKLPKQHSRSRTPVAKLQMNRSEGSLRQEALTLGISLGHQR
jgi:hypothetical protein